MGEGIEKNMFEKIAKELTLMCFFFINNNGLPDLYAEFWNDGGGGGTTSGW